MPLERAQRARGDGYIDLGSKALDTKILDTPVILFIDTRCGDGVAVLARDGRVRGILTTATRLLLTAMTGMTGMTGMTAMTAITAMNMMIGRSYTQVLLA